MVWLSSAECKVRLTCHDRRDEHVHFLVGGGVQFERVEADAVQSLVVDEERLVAVGYELIRA